MPSYVRNSLGATAADRCPTEGATQYCGRADYRAWKSQARDLYTRAIIPMWTALLDVSSSLPGAADGLAVLSARVAGYNADYNALPANASWWSSRTNKELVGRAVVLVTSGDALLSDLGQELESAGATVPIVLMPPAQPRDAKSPLGQYLPAASVIAAALLVVGLAAVASAPMRGQSGE